MAKLYIIKVASTLGAFLYDVMPLCPSSKSMEDDVKNVYPFGSYTDARPKGKFNYNLE